MDPFHPSSPSSSPSSSPVLQAIALWVNFMGFTDGKEPLIIYVLVTCGEWSVPIKGLSQAGLECRT